MALLCLANTPLPAPWVQWLEREPERPARLQTPYVAASGEFAPPAAAVAAAVSATGKAVGDGIHSSAAVGGGSVPEGGAAALQQAGAAAAAAPGAARNASGSAGSTGLGAAAAAENATAKLENVRLPKVILSRPASQREREHLLGESTPAPFFTRTRAPRPTQVQWETVSAAPRRAAGGHAAEALRAKVSEAMRVKAMETAQEATVVIDMFSTEFKLLLLLFGNECTAIGVTDAFGVLVMFVVALVLSNG